MESRDATAPLDDIFNETMEYLGRTYQKYAIESGTYFVPIDEEEEDRLESMHAVLKKVFDDRLIFPPVAAPTNILDCGCGSGSWAIEVAEEYPDSEVVAVDISPQLMSNDAPENLEFQIDDLNSRFTFRDNFFDLVHSQLVAGGIHASRWPSYVRDIYRVTKPGGWCQLVELYLNAQSDNGTLTHDHALSRWSRRYLGATQPPKDPRAALQLSTWLSNAGFVEVESKLVTLPMCAWSSDSRDSEIGRLNNPVIRQMLYSLALYSFTSLHGMNEEAFRQLVNEAYQEASDPAFKAYFALYIFIGRKPGREERRSSTR